MYEILAVIGLHNADPKTIQSRAFVRIDVLTGASAGGTTAAILGQRLLYGKDTFRSAYDNPLYDVWVKGISLSALLNANDKPIAEGGDPAKLSLLSSNLISSIARQALLREDAQGEVVAEGGAHDAVDPGRGIRLGLALTNINGINYGYPLIGGGRFQYTDFSDQLLHAGDVAFRTRSRRSVRWTRLCGDLHSRGHLFGPPRACGMERRSYAAASTGSGVPAARSGPRSARAFRANDLQRCALDRT